MGTDGMFGVVVSHPFAKDAKGWGTDGMFGVVVSHPFAKDAKGWGTDELMVHH
jgi:hypothetical protein